MHSLQISVRSMNLIWTLEGKNISKFNRTKKVIQDATTLVHPHIETSLAIIIAASTNHVEAALQHLVNDSWQPLSFFSKKT